MTDEIHVESAYCILTGSIGIGYDVTDMVSLLRYIEATSALET